MIKVKARIENETANPSEVIDTKFGSLFNGNDTNKQRNDRF